MVIRTATVSDWNEIDKLVHCSNYFNPINCSTLGGNWLVAEDEDEIKAAIWWFEGQGHAFVGYWVGTGIYGGAMVGAYLSKLLESRGIKLVHSVINANNERAVRTALHLGMGSTTTPYYYMTKEMGNGTV